MLMQLSQNLETTFGVKVPFRRLFAELSTVTALAAHLERELPAPPPPAAGLASRAAPIPASFAANGGAHPLAGSVPAGLLQAQVELVQAQVTALQAQAALLRSQIAALGAPSSPG
jgi:hypothetical protein